MANPIRAQQLFRYRSFHINKSQRLGHGSYGAVYKAKCDQLPCAAKVLHPTILDPSDPGAGKIMQRFQQECAFLENIRHPNIVQYLSMTRDPESRLPVLLMELLDESLTKLLEHSRQSLACHVQVDICHDIALAVAYLHSNDIIHRDLSSNNVLIMAKSRAKVTDFGMSKLAGAAPSMTPLTICPGTLAYMPPEALDEPPVYTKKLDCFSEGVIMIQVCTRQWPEPGPRTRTVPFPASPTGTTKVPVLEPERRKNHINMIDRGHDLLPIAMDCLNYQENERPSSEELCQRLASLKETREYRESVEQVERVQNDMAELERQMGEMQVREAATVQQLHVRDVEIQQLQRELQSQVQQLQGEIQSKNTQLTQKEHQIQQLNQQLEEQVAVTAEIQRTNQTSRPLVPKKQLKPGEWRDGGSTPYKMGRGAAVVDRNVAYFIHRDHPCHACLYNLSTRRWSELSVCPYANSSLAIVRGHLTAIGGIKRGQNPDNKLLIFVDGKNKKWVEHFPPMPTKRHNTAAVTTKQHLIVAGGGSGSNQLDTVEVMDIQTLVWSTAASLPHPYSLASATICGDRLYMLGGMHQEKLYAATRSRSVLTCSLTKLLQSCSITSSDSVWHRITDIPAYYSTCATVNGELVAVGGEDREGRNTSAVYMYNPAHDSWYIISNMPTARSFCLVAFLPTNEMMVVGGFTTSFYDSLTDIVERVYTI